MPQFPSFKDFGNRAIDALDGAQKRVQEADSAEAYLVHQGWVEVRAILEDELERDGISEPMRRFIIDKLVETVDRQEEVLEKGRITREKLLEWSKLAIGGVLSIGALGAAAVFKERF